MICELVDIISRDRIRLRLEREPEDIFLQMKGALAAWGVVAPTLASPCLVFECDRDARAWMDITAIRHARVSEGPIVAEGGKEPTFEGVPIFRFGDEHRFYD